jgi:hypothetical protein
MDSSSVQGRKNLGPLPWGGERNGAVAGAGEHRRTGADAPQSLRSAYYVWAPDGQSIVLVSSGSLYLYPFASRKPVHLALSKDHVLDPKFSPHVKWISFLSRHDLWIVPSAGGKEKRLTSGGSAVLLHGELDWVYQEELDLRSGYHRSPDSLVLRDRLP